MIKTSLTGSNNPFSPPGNLQKGFSLVELLVVLVIMAVLVGSISVVVLNQQETLQTQSRKIVQNMRLTQQRSIRDDSPYQIEIDLSTNSFQFYDEVIELPDTVSIAVRTAENQLIDDERVGMTFYPDFSSSGGVVTLESEEALFEISVTWISGKIVTRHHEKTT